MCPSMIRKLKVMVYFLKVFLLSKFKYFCFITILDMSLISRSYKNDHIIFNVGTPSLEAQALVSGNFFLPRYYIYTTGTRIPDPLFPHLVPPAIMVWIFVWKYIFEPFIHILQHFVLQLSFY
jgi:hypothetical protein